MLIVPLFYHSLLNGAPRNELVLAGVLFIIGAILSLRITRQVDEKHPVVPEVALEPELQTAVAV